MSTKVKKRKVSMEPLQDFTVTSYSDLHPDGAGPSDSSLFEELKTHSLELTEITVNQTAEVNFSSGPFYSDSSLDSSFKPQSILKSNSKAKRPFQKRPKKKVIEDNLFDSCLKDSFSDHSLENFQKPFQRKQKNKAIDNEFLSLSIDSKTPELNEDSIFKKPFQRKPKGKSYSNLFDSILKGSPSKTPNEKIHRPFQRRPQKEMSSNDFDEALLNESVTEQSSVENFVTRRKNKTKRSNESNIFDDVFDSSESDVSMSNQPVCLKRRLASNKSKNDTGLFDDLLDDTGSESHQDNPSVHYSYKNNENFSEDNSKSFSLVYNEETGNSTKVKDVTTNEEAVKPEIQNREINHYEEKIISSESPKQLNTLNNEELQVNVDEAKLSTCLSNKTDFLQVVEENEENCELHLPDEPENQLSKENDEKGGSKENETIISTKNDNGSIHTETEDEDTLNFETEDKSTTVDENSEEEIDSTAKSSVFEQSETRDEDTLLCETENKVMKEPEEAEGLNDSIAVSSQSIQDKEAFESKKCEEENKIPNHIASSILKRVDEHSSVPFNGVDMVICTPDGSFKDMPTSTPNIKGKRVSFQLNKEVQFISNKENTLQSIGGSKRRKSSLRYSKGINYSSNSTNFNRTDLRTSASLKVDWHRDSDLWKQSNVFNSSNQHATENQLGNHSSAFIESLVYLEPSRSRTPVSESVYIDIHPSICSAKSLSGNNSGKLSLANDTTKGLGHTSNRKLNSVTDTSSIGSAEFRLELVSGEESGEEEKNSEEDKHKTIENEKETEEDEGENIQSDEEEQYEEDEGENVQSDEEEQYEEVEIEEEEVEDKEVEIEEEEVEIEDEEVEIEDEEVEDKEVEIEEEEVEIEYEEDEELEDEELEEIEDKEKGVQSECKEDDTILEDKEHERSADEVVNTSAQVIPEQELDETNASFPQDQREMINDNIGSDDEECIAVDCLESSEQDENLNPSINKTQESKTQSKRRMRKSSLFEEKRFQLPSKTQLQDILNKLPISALKKRTRPKCMSNENYISREQLQQYEIEERVIMNQKKKTQKINAFPGSSKLKRPKKWVSSKLYDFLISKLKPIYGIRSRVKAEELVLFLVDCVECITNKNELLQEDVNEMKIQLATLGIVKTHWDFFNFVNHYFEYNFKEKMFPCVPGEPSAFEFGPTNVMENIL